MSNKVTGEREAAISLTLDEKIVLPAFTQQPLNDRRSCTGVIHYKDIQYNTTRTFEKIY